MTYAYYQSVIRGEEMPLGLVDLDIFEENIRQILLRAKGTRIRVATKSVRCVSLLRRLLDADANIQGLMCYTAREAVWLSEQGFDDLLVAYPTYHLEQIRAVAQAVKRGVSIYLMVDKVEHLTQIQQVGKEENVVLPVCLDVDVSTKFPFLHFGVYRSSIRSKNDVVAFVEQVKSCPNIRLAGLMGYEAQIAGIVDNMKGQGVKNAIIRFLKRRSIPKIVALRKAAVKYLESQGIKLDFVNGGGTGSVESTIQEEVVTEVTVGSGFYTSTLFDNYRAFRHLPAFIYAVEVVRNPEPNIFTCLGGGYVASGPAGIDKVPRPHLPEGGKLISHEMAGEVQTPVKYKEDMGLNLGDPIFFRHAKAGELCEHFNEICLVSSGKIERKVKTYRGEGKVFL